MTLVRFIICAGLCVLPVPAMPPQLPADFAERLVGLEQASASQPGNVELLDALAGSYAMAGRYPDAIRIVEQILAHAGATKELQLRLAHLYSWSGQNERALAALNAVGEPLDTETAEFRCQVLSASAKAARAAECYKALLPRQPRDPARWADGELALARNLAWSGKVHAAIGQYGVYHAGVPGDRVAAMEWIRLLLQTGGYGKAELVCDELLASKPGDAAVLALKAEVLHWAGRRSHAALQLAEAAASLDATLPDARVGEIYALRDLGSQRAARRSFDTLAARVREGGGLSPEASYAGAYRYLDRQFREAPRLTAETAHADYQDSDGIRDRDTDLRLAVTSGDHILRFDIDRFNSSAPAGSVFSGGEGAANATRAIAGADLHVAPGMFLRAAGGGYTESGHSGIRPAFRIAWSAEPVDRWNFEASVARELVALTPKSIVQGIADYAARETVGFHWNARTSARAIFEQRLWSDSNRSMAGDASFQRVLRYARAFSVDGGIQMHLESYRYDMLSRSGYFSPDYCVRYQGSVGAHGELGNRIQYEVRTESGVQRLARGADLRRSTAVSSSVRLRLNQSFGLLAAWQWRNYSLISLNGWYRQFSINLDVHR
jgi:tetratricopeptide (TPR) repeat protein